MRKTKPKYAVIANDEVVSFTLYKWCADNLVNIDKMKKDRRVIVNGVEYRLEILY